MYPVGTTELFLFSVLLPVSFFVLFLLSGTGGVGVGVGVGSGGLGVVSLSSEKLRSFKALCIPVPY